MRHPKPDEVGPDQESVWDYPRPPALERSSKLVEVYFAGELIAKTTNAWRVLETSHPPTWYLPPDDIEMQYIVPVQGSSFCEWKGQAFYRDVVVGDQVAARAAWGYANPTSRFAPIAHHLAFYAHAMDRCVVDSEEVQAQPGNFYGGWVTSDVAGPFKGAPGSRGW